MSVERVSSRAAGPVRAPPLSPRRFRTRARGAVLLSFLSEALILAASGGVAGVVVAAAGVYLFKALLVEALGFPFILPSLAPLGLVVGIGLALALAVAALAAVVPAFRISRQEPALSMRE